MNGRIGTAEADCVPWDRGSRKNACDLDSSQRKFLVWPPQKMNLQPNFSSWEPTTRTRSQLLITYQNSWARSHDPLNAARPAGVTCLQKRPRTPSVHTAPNSWLMRRMPGSFVYPRIGELVMLRPLIVSS